ncbi:MAG: hypothetical protein ACKOHI_10925 [Phycisphaerales bacterium]
MTDLPTAVPDAAAAKPRARSLRAQGADLRARFDALPSRQRWLVVAVLAVAGYLVVDEYVWSWSRAWQAESVQIEAALRRGAARRAPASVDLARAVATFGAVEPPADAARGREELAQAIEDVAKAHKVAGYSYEVRVGPRVKDPDAAVLAPAIERIQAEVRFDTTADELPRIVADLEAHPAIEAISALRIQRNDQARKMNVQATIEAWVVAGRGRRDR